MPSQFPGESKPGGSNTQVQFNDSDEFGGDAGLVYNKSTDVLTAGKLASTDTSATSIDVAGGITAGTGNVAIVNAAGKIPALSSAYLASLDASALTGIGGGKVLQVVAANHTTSVSTTTSTFVDAGLTAALTPAGTGSKILVYGTVNGCRKDGSTGVGLALGEDIGGGGYSLFQNTLEGLGGYDAGSSTNMIGSIGFGALRSPSTTSAVTYKIQLKSTLNTGTVYTNQSTCVSWIVLMEIAA